MALYRWATFQDLLALQERMNQILEEAIRRVGLSPEDRGGGPGQWRPACDMFETPDMVHLMVELPGVRRDQIDLQVVGERLVIRGERSIPENTSKEAFLRMERTYGPFRRELDLPVDVVAEKTEADFVAGVLQVRIPRRGEGRNVPVGRNGGGDS